MNAATRTANQMPTMNSTLSLRGLQGIGCFPLKRCVSLEKRQRRFFNG
jgi:hypothetical protein